MKKTNSVYDFVLISKERGGSFKIKSAPDHQLNIYQWLVAEGYCRTNHNVKIITFKKDGDGIHPVSLFDMKSAFVGYLETANFYDLPEAMSKNDILEFSGKESLRTFTSIFLNHQPV